MRDGLALVAVAMTLVGIALAFILQSDASVRAALMPGPLSNAHSSIEDCATCHVGSGAGKLNWLATLGQGKPHADSQACMTCHQTPNSTLVRASRPELGTALAAHGTSVATLRASTERQTLAAARSLVAAPTMAIVQGIAFPTEAIVDKGLDCATCHRDHRGANAGLTQMADNRCSSCHTVKVDSFDGSHPQFEGYPYKRRTRIAYDHTGHFDKHFPEIAKKDAGKTIPATCSGCHDSGVDRRIMAVKSFDTTCRSCHLDQIIGKDRASGPKGIAVLSLPGLDLATLKKKKALIGEWPNESEAGLTPFMKVMISKTERGRTTLNALEPLGLQNLGGASDAQIKAVTDLVWEIKQLYFDLITKPTVDVLSGVSFGGEGNLSASLVGDLTANLPLDVVSAAQQHWLPNLGSEIAMPRDARLAAGAKPSRQAAVPVGKAPTVASKSEPPDRINRPNADAQPTTASAQPAALAQQAASAQQTVAADAGAVDGRANNGRAAKVEEPKSTAGKSADDLLYPTQDEIKAMGRRGEGLAASAQSRNELRSEPRSDLGSRASSSPDLSAKPARAPAAANANASPPPTPSQSAAVVAKEPKPRSEAASQDDDLLHPTPEEQRNLPVRIKNTTPSAAATEPPPRTDRVIAVAVDAGGSSNDARTITTGSVDRAGSRVVQDTSPAPLQPMKIESDIDPESWAGHGGWYRQDYAILYRPIGHKDKLITTWLTLTGPHATPGDKSPLAAVFAALTAKDAQGSCTKCHSVDRVPGSVAGAVQSNVAGDGAAGALASGRKVNFSPASVKINQQQPQFTRFIHEPHFATTDNRGCISCHKLEKGQSAAVIDGYKQGNPLAFSSNFSAVDKQLCQTCHNSARVRQDCTTCHTYHVDRMPTPAMATRIPAE